MRTADALRRTGISIESTATLREAAQLMESAGVGTLVIIDGGSPTGIVTDRDLVCRGLARSADPQGRIDSIMSSPVATIDAEADLRDAFAILSERAIRRLVVMSGTEFVGVISIDDLLMNIAADLSHVVRPITAEVLFSQHDASVPDIRT